MTGPPLVILKTQINPLHPGTLGIVRSLGRLGVPVDVLGETPGSPVSRSRYVRSVRPLPRPDLARGELVDLLLASAPAERPVLVPVDDVGAVLVSEHADRLARGYRFPRLPRGLAALVCDKVGLTRLALDAQVPTPLCWVPGSEEELAGLAARIEFPVVVKARDPRLLAATPGATSVGIAGDPSALLRLWRTHLVDGKPNCLVQEFIPGGPDSVWMVNAYVDGASALRLAASARKLRQRPPGTGATTLGMCEHNPEVLQLTARLVRSIGYRGVLDIGWRYDARDGRYKVLDLNPRVGASFRLFAASTGADVVRALYADLTGGALPTGDVKEGRRWLDEYDDLRVARRYLRSGTTLPAYLRSLGRVDERVWWDVHDPAPALTAIGEGLRRRMTARPTGGGGSRDGASPSVDPAAPAGYFDDRSVFWDDLYDGDDVFAQIHRRRHETALGWLADGKRGDPAGPAVALEFGCGAGRLTAELSRRCRVVALDISTQMLRRTRRRVPGDALFVCADAARVPLPDASVDVVAGLGVLPWVPDDVAVVREVGRVLRPGGRAVLNVDNRWRLATLLDPLQSPLTGPARRHLRLRRRRSLPPAHPPVSMTTAPRFRAALGSAGLRVSAERWIGFGPCSFLGRTVLPRRLTAAVDARLQRRADAGRPVRFLASQYVVLCVRPSQEDTVEHR